MKNTTVIALVSRDSVSLALPGPEEGTHGAILATVRGGRAAYAWARANGFQIKAGTLLPEDKITMRVGK